MEHCGFQYVTEYSQNVKILSDMIEWQVEGHK